MTEPTFDDLYTDFTEAYIARYGEKSYEENKQIATDNIEQLLKHGVRRHYSNLGKKMNAKKGFGTHRDKASELGAKGGRSGRNS